jgi:hypothetical protein
MSGGAAQATPQLDRQVQFFCPQQSRCVYIILIRDGHCVPGYTALGFLPLLGFSRPLLRRPMEARRRGSGWTSPSCRLLLTDGDRRHTPFTCRAERWPPHCRTSRICSDYHSTGQQLGPGRFNLTGGRAWRHASRWSSAAQVSPLCEPTQRRHLGHPRGGCFSSRYVTSYLREQWTIYSV